MSYEIETRVIKHHQWFVHTFKNASTLTEAKRWLRAERKFYRRQGYGVKATIKGGDTGPAQP